MPKEGYIKMRKTLLAIVAIAAAGVAMIATLTPAGAQQQLPYIAAAANQYGYGFGQGYSMEQARQIAIYQCQSSTGAPCPRALSVSDRNHWHLVVVRCDTGYSTGMTPQGWDRAYAIAVRKIDGARCEEVLAR